jgi:hypothetical protein
MSKQRAARRAQRETAQQQAAVARDRRNARLKRRRNRRDRLAAPFRWTAARVRRTARSFARRTKAQRAILGGALLVVLAVLALAPSWGLKLALLGLTVLLLPVAWTVASGRR